MTIYMCTHTPAIFLHPSAHNLTQMLKTFSAYIKITKWDPLFLCHESTVLLSALWVSRTMAVAMVMPHCNIPLQLAHPPMLAAAPKLGKNKKKQTKTTTKEGGGKEKRGETRVVGGCSRIHQNANHAFLTVCPSLCRSQCPRP